MTTEDRDIVSGKTSGPARHGPRCCSKMVLRVSSHSFRLPLDDYPPKTLSRLGRFRRSRAAGTRKHVADDACAPNGTPVVAVAEGRVRFAAQVGECFDNWGWLVVVEHAWPGEPRICSIYGHCEPVDGIAAGSEVSHGQQIATIRNDCVPHIHFGIYAGDFGASDGSYPDWLLGYLPTAGRARTSDGGPGTVDPWVRPRPHVAPVPGPESKHRSAGTPAKS
jgi:murein DD-endopeptidase MepM/ murein hydrolase activator NlpD